MTISMYKVSVPVFVQHLTALSGVLDKATTHIESKKLEPAFFIGMRLYPDMYPLTRQVQQATAHPIRACSALGIASTADFNGAQTEGAGLWQVSIKDGWRVSSSTKTSPSRTHSPDSK